MELEVFAPRLIINFRSRAPCARFPRAARFMALACASSCRLLGEERRRSCAGESARRPARGNAPAAVPVVLPLATPTPPSVAGPALLAPCVVWPRLPTVSSPGHLRSPLLPRIPSCSHDCSSRLGLSTFVATAVTLFLFLLLVSASCRHFPSCVQKLVFSPAACAFSVSFCSIEPPTTVQCSIGFLSRCFRACTLSGGFLLCPFGAGFLVPPTYPILALRTVHLGAPCDNTAVPESGLVGASRLLYIHRQVQCSSTFRNLPTAALAGVPLNVTYCLPSSSSLTQPDKVMSKMLTFKSCHIAGSTLYRNTRGCLSASNAPQYFCRQAV